MEKEDFKDLLTNFAYFALVILLLVGFDKLMHFLG